MDIKASPEVLIRTLRIISDWFDDQAALTETEGDFWDHTIRARALDEAADEIERLQKEKRALALDWLAEQVQTAEQIDDLHKEIERLKDKCDRQAMILRRLTPENYPNTLFISGVVGGKDNNNMPEKLLVVPAYGVDFSYIYQRTDKTTGMEW
jgi:hypothetical protein